MKETCLARVRQASFCNNFCNFLARSLNTNMMICVGLWKSAGCGTRVTKTKKKKEQNKKKINTECLTRTQPFLLYLDTFSWYFWEGNVRNDKKKKKKKINKEICIDKITNLEASFSFLFFFFFLFSFLFFLFFFLSIYSFSFFWRRGHKFGVNSYWKSCEWL